MRPSMVDIQTDYVNLVCLASIPLLECNRVLYVLSALNFVFVTVSLALFAIMG